MKNIIAIFFFTVVFFVSGYSQNTNYHLQINILKQNNPTNLKLKKTKFSVKDSTLLYAKLQNIISHLVKSGYLSASIDSLIKDSTNYIAYLYVGELFKWGKLSGKDLDEGTSVYDFEKFRGEDIDFEIFRNEQKQLLDSYAKNGYPFVQIGIDSLTVENNRFNTVLDVNKNRKFYFDTIFIKGKVNVSKKLIYKYIGIKPNDVFDQRKVDNIDYKLNKLAYLSITKPAELEFIENKADVYVYLKKKKSNFFSGIIGFSNSEAESGKLQLTGNIKLDLNNSFGIGENINLVWESYKDSSQFLTSRLSFPYLFFLPIGFSVGFQLDKDVLDYLNLNYSFALSYDLNPNNGFQVYFKRNHSFLINNEPDNNLNYENTNSYTLGLSATINESDQTISPRKGYLVNLFTGYGSRQHSQTGDVALFEAGFVGAFYWRISNNITFSFKNSSEGIFQDNSFYENEMFKLGGIKSIRGFDEKSILASAYSIFTFEPQYFIGKYSFLSVFADYIYFEKDAFEQNIKSDGLGLGTGIVIDTKAGLLSLNFAVGKLDNNPFRLSNTKVHFAYVVRF